MSARHEEADTHASDPLDRMAVLQVLLDEPGGGSVHVAALEDLLGGRVDLHILSIPSLRLGPNPGGWVGVVRDIRRAMRSRRVDVIHAHGTRAAAAVRLSQAFRTQAPMVVTIHGLHLMRRSPGLRARVATRFALAKARRIFVISYSDLHTLLEERLAVGERLVRIAPPFRAPARRDRKESRREMGFDLDATVVLWMGRFEDVKDPHLFVETAAVTPGGGTIFVMAGDGPLKAEVERAAVTLAAPVRFLGWVDDPSIALSGADIVVSTSRWEGFPYGLLEAAACGSFVVATDVPGNRDAVEAGVPGTLVSDRKPERLAEAIRAAIDDDARANAARVGPEVAAVISETGDPSEDLLRAYREAARAQ